MRLIDADELPTHKFVGVIGEAEKSSYVVGWNTAIEAVVENAPTIDAVPVVRCRECKYNTTEKKCLNPNSIIKIPSIPSDNDFCSYGERREDGDKV